MAAQRDVPVTETGKAVSLNTAAMAHAVTGH